MGLDVGALTTRETIALCGVVPGLKLGDLAALENSQGGLLDWPADKALLLAVGIFWIEKRRTEPAYTFEQAIDDFDARAEEPPDPTAAAQPTPNTSD